MKIKFILQFLVAGMLALSCTSEDKDQTVAPQATSIASFKEGDVTFANSILSFENSETFIAFNEKLGSDQSFANHIKETYGGALLIGNLESSTKDETLNYVISNVPNNHLYILNKDGAYIVGNDYVRFGKLGVYHVDVKLKDKINFATESSIDLAIAKKGVYGFEVLSKSSVNGRYIIGRDAADAHWQYQFNQVYPVNGIRKYVYEIVSFRQQNGGDDYLHELLLKLKLEYKGSSWRAAGESRTISWDLDWDGNWHYGGGSNTALFPFVGGAQSSVTTSSEYQLPIKIIDHQTNAQGASAYWDVQITGSITQQVVGDVSGNSWTCTGNSGVLW